MADKLNLFFISRTYPEKPLPIISIADNSVIPEHQYQFKAPAQRLSFIGRTCVQHFTGDECDRGRDEQTGQAILVCRHHCSTDGCNAGQIPLGSVLTLLSLIMLVIFV